MVNPIIDSKKGFSGLVNTNEVFGYLYLPTGSIKAVVILAKGGPSFSDDGKNKVWPVCKKNNVALFVPDYLGSGRSAGGNFSMKNCLETLQLSEEALVGKQNWLDTYSGNKFQVKFTNIILVGSSWGGSIAPFYFNYNPQTVIEKLGLFSPVTEWNSQDRYLVEEETDGVFGTVNFIV